MLNDAMNFSVLINMHWFKLWFVSGPKFWQEAFPSLKIHVEFKNKWSGFLKECSCFGKLLNKFQINLKQFSLVENKKASPPSLENPDQECNLEFFGK